MKEAWQKAPLTSLIILIQVIVFILMTLAGGSTNSQVLIEFGARYTPLIKAGEWWRLITPGFVHIGLTHLVVNSVTLYFIGMYIENLFGHWRFLAIYLVSTLMGNLASAVFLPQSISAGASTGIFGLFGAFLMLGLAFWDEPAIHSLAHQFLILVLLNLGTDILVPGIDLAGHLGGLLGGFFMAAVVGAPRLGRMDLLKRFLSGTILIVTITVFFGNGIAKMKPIREIRTLYDVQQLLKRFNVFVYVGKRLWDIELMAIEVDNLYQAGVLDKDLYMQAKLVLRKEHRIEEELNQKNKSPY